MNVTSHVWKLVERSEDGHLFVEGPMRGTFNIAKDQPLWMCSLCGEATNQDPLDVPPEWFKPCPGERPKTDKVTVWRRFKRWLTGTRVGLVVHVLRKRPLMLHLEINKGILILDPLKSTRIADCQFIGAVPPEGPDTAVLIPAPSESVRP